MHPAVTAAENLPDAEGQSPYWPQYRMDEFSPAPQTRSPELFYRLLSASENELLWNLFQFL